MYFPFALPDHKPITVLNDFNIQHISSAHDSYRMILRYINTRIFNVFSQQMGTKNVLPYLGNNLLNG